VSLIRPRFVRGFGAVLLAASGIAGVESVSLAAQESGAGKPPVEERLSRIAADLFSRSPNVKEDIAELKAILAADARSAQAHMLLGIAYRTQGSPDLMGEAVGELRQALEADPSLLPARLYLAHLYLDLARPERARDELQTALARAPGQPQFLALLAECERQLGHPDKALDLTGQALAQDPSSAEARYYRGLALADLKRRDEAIQEFEQSVRAGGRRPEVYGSLGTAYLEAGRVDEAIASLTDGVKLDPSRPDLMIPLARAYRLKGQLTRADAALTTVKSLVAATAVSAADQHTQRDLYFEEGLLRLKQAQIDAAARSLRKVVDLDPNYGPGYRYLAEVYLRQGLYPRALDQATRAEKLGAPLPADLQKTLQEKLRASRPKGHE
jgi:tetratricopeptide (TPR) repeat protein